mmetsp:Transcript_34230/g.78037  ORF Transcript_34230/g.78037 Transcript_34230/m.78037 type:complete len:371 (+) Transcript_34230:60-1172(+)
MKAIQAWFLWSICFRHATGLRAGTGAADAQGLDVASDAIGAAERQCPGVCMSMNYAFMKSDFVCDAKIREEVNKRCRFSMCAECSGGGSTQVPAIPCCTPGCEKLSEVPGVEVMAAAIGRELSKSELEKLDKMKETAEEASASSLPAFVAAVLKAYKAAQGEICNLQHGVTWCPPGTSSPGNMYRQDGEPFCCRRVTEEERKEDGEDIEKSAVEWLENVKKPAEEQKPVVDPDCSRNAVYRFHRKRLEGKSEEVCIDHKTRLPADAKCCTKHASTLDNAVGNATLAMQACEEVPRKYCMAEVKSFLQWRSKKKAKKVRKIPDGFACKRMYWCRDQPGKGMKEKVGPVNHAAECGELQLTAYRVCTAVPYG